MSVMDGRAKESAERHALGPKPEGAEMRFSEHVSKEIRACRFEFRYGFMHNEPYVISPLSWEMRNDIPEDIAAYKNTFQLSVRSRWFGLAEPAVYLRRGDKIVGNLLAPFEKKLLVEAWDYANEIETERRKTAKATEEAERRRAAWWP